MRKLGKKIHKKTSLTGAIRRIQKGTSGLYGLKRLTANNQKKQRGDKHEAELVRLLYGKQTNRPAYAVGYGRKSAADTENRYVGFQPESLVVL